MKKNKKNTRFIISVTIMFILIIIKIILNDQTVVKNETVITAKSEAINLENDKLNVLYLYVGQADTTLIKHEDKIILIDAGNNEDGKNIVEFLKNLGITKIDYLIATHHDEDHIGGMDDIVKAFEFEKIYISDGGEQTKTYQNLVNAVKSKKKELIIPKKGEELKINGIEAKFVAVPKFDGKDDNNASLVLQINKGKKKFLFMGDAEKKVESLQKWEDIDVLKVGHHGSGSSSSDEFLKQVKPEISVISVGKNNKYRLPNVKAMERLEKTRTKILRTDENQSSFLIKTDGEKFEITEEKINLDGNE